LSYESNKRTEYKELSQLAIISIRQLNSFLFIP